MKKPVRDEAYWKAARERYLEETAKRNEETVNSPEGQRRQRERVLNRRWR